MNAEESGAVFDQLVKTRWDVIGGYRGFVPQAAMFGWVIDGQHAAGSVVGALKPVGEGQREVVLIDFPSVDLTTEGTANTQSYGLYFTADSLRQGGW